MNKSIFPIDTFWIPAQQHAGMTAFITCMLHQYQSEEQADVFVLFQPERDMSLHSVSFQPKRETSLLRVISTGARNERNGEILPLRKF